MRIFKRLLYKPWFAVKTVCGGFGLCSFFQDIEFLNRWLSEASAHSQILTVALRYLGDAVDAYRSVVRAILGFVGLNSPQVLIDLSVSLLLASLLSRLLFGLSSHSYWRDFLGRDEAGKQYNYTGWLMRWMLKSSSFFTLFARAGTALLTKDHDSLYQLHPLLMARTAATACAIGLFLVMVIIFWLDLFFRVYLY